MTIVLKRVSTLKTLKRERWNLKRNTSYAPAFHKPLSAKDPPYTFTSFHLPLLNMK